MYLRSFTLAALAALSLSILLACRPALADMLDIRKADNGVTLDAGESYLDYAETASGSTLDTEKGWLPTVGLGFGMLASQNAPISNLFFRLDGRASIGSTTYDGALCDAFGDCTPYDSSTDDKIYTGTGEIGRAVELGPSLLLTPYAEIGYRYWSRNLKGIGGYGEAYENWEGLGGLLLQYSPAQRWVLSLNGAGGTTFAASMKTFGETFSLGNAAIWRAQTKAGYRLTDHIELSLSAEYESFGYGASPVDARGYYEPDSTTHQTTVLLGVAYHFF